MGGAGIGAKLAAIACGAAIALAGAGDAADARRGGKRGGKGRGHDRIARELRALDGKNNNRHHPQWGASGAVYRREAPARYADGVGAIDDSLPNPRYVSNRIFNDLAQNVFSSREVTQWAWAWGQFMDHTFGLVDEGGEAANIGFDRGDPLEDSRNDFDSIFFTRSGVAPGSGGGSSNPRQQTNTVSSYIDGWSVYGGERSRLEWLREGAFDGRLRNNGARLLLSDGYLPRSDARGDAGSAPEMALDGPLRGDAAAARVAGDVRANENVALTAVHTLFAREHNRIVASLPARMPRRRKFEIARRVVGAEQQWITYRQFLPALGVRLRPYRGYDPRVDATLTDEFATVGYRAHSMIHGGFTITTTSSRYTAAELSDFEDTGIFVTPMGSAVRLFVPLDVAFFNPDLLERLELGAVLESLGQGPQYRNDEQIDVTLRSMEFETGDRTGLVDLGAIDIQRGRDHGMPSYNELRRAHGLPPVRSFTELTGERSDHFPRGLGIDDPEILEFTSLLDAEGNEVEPDTPEARTDVRFATRRSTLAARLRAIYGSVDRVDAFVGMVSEPHVRGAEMGPLQLRIWQRQFEALRDGDRFFHARDRKLGKIERRFGIDYRVGLAELIDRNSDADQSRAAGPNPFIAE